MSRIVINGDVSLKKNNATDAQGVAIPPTLEALGYGEIAINYNAKDACIFIKALDANGQQKIVKFVGEEVIAKTLGDILGESAADLATLKEMIKLFEGSSSDVLTLVKNLQTEVALKATKTYVDGELAKKLGKTETAANSVLFNGLAIDQMPSQVNFGETVDLNLVRDGIMGGKLFNASNAPHPYYAFLSVGYDKFKMQLNGYNNDLRFRAGSESGIDDKPWNKVYHSGNCNLPTVDWNAEVMYAKTHTIRHSGIYSYFGAFGGDTYLWTESDHDLKFGTNNIERIRITKSGALLVGNSKANGAGFLDITPQGFNVDNLPILIQGFYCNDGKRQDITFQPHGGNVGFGTTNPITKVHALGIISAGDTGNCVAQIYGSEGNTGTFASFTQYNWYSTNWKAGIRRGASTDYKCFSIAKNDVDFLTITDDHIVSRNRVGLGCNPTITLAIGDSDTGFNWVSDGLLGAMANDVQSFNWNSQRVYFNIPIQGASSARFDGDVIADSNGTGSSYFFRPAIHGFGWNDGMAAFNTDIRNNANATPILLARREGGVDRLFSIEQLNDGSRTKISSNSFSNISIHSNGKTSIGSIETATEMLDVFGNELVRGNLRVLGETYTYSVDGIETFEAGGGATRLADLTDVDLTGAQGNFVLYQSTETNANGDRIWKARSDAKTWSDISGKPSEFMPVAHNHIGSNYTTLSDQRLKTNFSDLSNPLNTILSINTYSFEWNDDAIDKFGFINKRSNGVKAQELQKILPDLVNPMSDGTLTVDYIQIIPYLIAAFKELHYALQDKNIAITNATKEYKRMYGANEKLAKRVSELESELINLKNQIAA